MAVVRALQCTVIGDSEADAAACAAAESVGALLAELGIVLVCGGGAGAMEAACRGARARGGMTVGILKTDRVEDANSSCSVVVPTGMGEGRNLVNVLAGDFVIGMGRSAGSLSELCFAKIHSRAIFLLEPFSVPMEALAEVGLDGGGGAGIVSCASMDELRREVIWFVDMWRAARSGM
jgi:hypothetical protein